jgi:hypothetical protein
VARTPAAVAAAAPEGLPAGTPLSAVKPFSLTPLHPSAPPCTPASDILAASPEPPSPAPCALLDAAAGIAAALRTPPAGQLPAGCPPGTPASVLLGQRDDSGAAHGLPATPATGSSALQPAQQQQMAVEQRLEAARQRLGHTQLERMLHDLGATPGAAAAPAPSPYMSPLMAQAACASTSLASRFAAVGSPLAAAPARRPSNPTPERAGVHEAAEEPEAAEAAEAATPAPAARAASPAVPHTAASGIGARPGLRHGWAPTASPASASQPQRQAQSELSDASAAGTVSFNGSVCASAACEPSSVSSKGARPVQQQQQQRGSGVQSPAPAAPGSLDFSFCPSGPQAPAQQPLQAAEAGAPGLDAQQQQQQQQVPGGAWEHDMLALTPAGRIGERRVLAAQTACSASSASLACSGACPLPACTPGESLANQS